jgi:hypothetical protein
MKSYSFNGGPLDGDIIIVSDPAQEIILGKVDSEDAVFYWLEGGVYQFKDKRYWPGKSKVE